MSFLFRIAGLSVVLGGSLISGCTAPGNALIDARAVLEGPVEEAVLIPDVSPVFNREPGISTREAFRGPLLAVLREGGPPTDSRGTLAPGHVRATPRGRHQDDVLVEVINVEGTPVNSFAMPSYEDADNEFSIHIGPSWWDELPDHQPRVAFPTSAGFGSQEEYGTAAGLSFRRRIADADVCSLWLGLDLAFMSHTEDDSYRVQLPNGEIVDDDVSADVTYGTLAARIDVPVGPLAIFVGGGAGLYNLSFDEEDSYYSSDEIVDDTSFGGYVQLGLDCPLGENWSVRIEDRMHLVHFEGLDRFTPGNDSLSGPIHTFLVGLGLRF